ncbi:translocation/assembly module TamB domain-containing protein [Xanthomonas arboricola]|uniref:translocation/assembly module TamB domain-containing protein n=1 Tax=Xanthomonas arboricola TaxID=56448 RepID=UPI000C86A780|nr:translocation/assembly module TamB domain-containing protein [Xanthomonas arboricola]PMR86228.1 pathogenicity protein [Xanthomonas arboricola pv. juglandis]
MSTPTPTPPPAPRRARFYRRRRFWVGSGLTVLGLVLLALIAVYWLLQTVAGRDVLLAQVTARLPVGATFTYGKVEGPVVGPLTLRDVDFRYQDIHFTAERVYLEPDLRPLLGRKLQLDAVQVSNASLNLGKSEEPFTLPSWPESLPQINVPLAIQADKIAVENLRITQLQQPMIVLHKVQGGLEVATGELRTRNLVVDTDMGDFRLHGDYVPNDDYRADLTATAVLPAARGRTPASLGLVARGDLDKMEVAIAGRAPAPLQASLVFTGRDDPTWAFKAVTDALDTSLLMPATNGQYAAPATPIALNLQASGKGGNADLQGSVKQGELSATLQPSHISLLDQVITVEPLVIDAFEGRAQLRGTADFRDTQNPSFRFAVNASGLRFTPMPDPATPDAPVVPVVPVELVDARLGVAGNLKAWAAIGRATLERDGQQAALVFDSRGNDQRAQLKQVQAKTPGGALDLTGEVGWTPELQWDVTAQLAKFDPGYFAPGWNGNLSGKVASKGRQLPAPAGGVSPGFEATADIPSLTGQLRQRALSANGKFALRGEQGEGQLQLSLGNSRITAKGKVGDQLDIAAQLQPLQLDDVLPGATGTMRGQLQVSGKRDAPDITADIVGNGLRWNDYSAQSISLRGRLPWRGSDGQLALQGTAIEAGVVLDSVRVQARGAVEALRLDADIANGMANVALQGDVRRNGERWQGQVATLRIAPAKGDAWALHQPAQFSTDGAAFTLSDTCLGAATGGALCASANWPREGMVVHGDALPLSLVQPWLPKQQGRQIYLRGELALDGSFKPRGNAWEGSFRIASPEGGIRLGETRYAAVAGNPNRGELLRYDQFSVQADFTPQQIQAKLGIGFQGAGFVDAKFNTGWDAYAPLNGELYLNMSRLYWLELVVADVVQPKGLVEGHVSLRGTRDKPLLGGDATLSNFTAEYPSMGLTLSEGKGRFDALPDGSAKITASAKSGQGTLNIDGGLSWFGTSTPLLLNIRGENVLAYNTSELRIIANPDMQFGITDNTMQLRGKVTVPEADIDLERLDRGTSVSEDVVVLDPVDPEEAPASPLDMDLAIVLGDKVNMSGFGLKGGLSGQMQIRARPGREMTANGGLDVRGRYKAYGQDLTISRGQLTWNNNIVSDPRVSLRAERKVGDVTAGIDVSGRAESPRADVWSEPAMSQSEALSYLVLGRGLSTASSDETQQVSAASAALSAGSSLIASQIGAKLGLDEAGVSESSTVGSVVGFGKYLSPKLYVGYGVSMVGSGSVLTLKYLLSRGFDIEAESSTVETKGSVNWRREK